MPTQNQAVEPRVLRNMSRVAFVGAFIEPLIGIILGHLALYEYKNGDAKNKESRAYAIAGLTIGYVNLATRLLLLGTLFTLAAYSAKNGMALY
jgi:hypothetical protein